MRVNTLLAAAACCGLVVGAAVGATSADVPGRRAPIATDCPTSAGIKLEPLQLSIAGGDQGASVSVGLSAKLEDVRSNWLVDVGNERVADCLIAGSPFAGQPSEYEWNAVTHRLSLAYAPALLPLTSKTDREQDDRIAAQDGQRPAVIAALEGRDLVVDVDLCASVAPQVGCVTPTSGIIEVRLADGVVDPGATVAQQPAPTKFKTEAGYKVLSWVFPSTEPPPHIRMRVPLALDFAAKTYTTSDQSRVVLEVGDWAIEVSLAQMATSLSSLMVVVLAWLLLRRFGSSLSRWQAISLAGAYFVTVAGMVIQLPPNLHDSSSPWLSTFWIPMIWATIAILLWMNRRLIAITLGGLLLAAVGGWISTRAGAGETALEIVGPWLQSIGAGAVFVCALVSVGVRLRLAAHALPESTAPLVPVWLSQAPSRLGPTVVRVAGVSLVLAIGVLVGDSLGRELAAAGGAGAESAFSPVHVVDLAILNAGWILLALSTVLVFGLLVASATQTGLVRDSTAAIRATMTFLIAVVAPPAAVLWTGIGLPVWLITWAVLYRSVRLSDQFTDPDLGDETLGAGVIAAPPASASDTLRRSLRLERDRRELTELDRQVSSGTVELSVLDERVAELRQRLATDTTRFLFARGVYGATWRNARLAAWAGGVLAVVPLGAYIWNLAQNLPQGLTYNNGLYLVVSVLTEYIRWVGAAFAFGALYPLLPTRLGGTKGAVLGAAWSAASIVSALVGHWFVGGDSSLWLYLSLQMFLFLVGVGLAYDLLTLNAAGGSYRRLADLYQLHSVRRLASYVGPVFLAVLALAQQVNSGAGLDFAKQVVDSVLPLLGG